jgi:uroporphyrinogen III methyltransferase/synthase
MKPASVYLIGAGPGDPDLITVRGLRHLNAADVVVYDHLVHPHLLQSVKPEAEQIDVGAAAPRPLEQDAINLLIADKAREGKTVVRLKCGDPFIFDNNGKEALFLHSQGIPFEVIPGVPPTITRPCDGDVPLAYPEASDAIVLIRGHKAKTNTPPNVDRKKVAPLARTVVSYADGPPLETTIDKRITHEPSPEKPTTLITRPTLPIQRASADTLKGMPHVVRETARLGSGVSDIGPIARFRKYLRWCDPRPLFGKRILVTRPEAQATELVDLLWNLGAEPIEAPMIKVEPPEDCGPLDEACELVTTFDWIIFTSTNGVDAFLQRLCRGTRDVRALKGVQLCAVGSATAERLLRYGLRVDLVPEEHRSEAVVEALLNTEDLSERRILLPRADLARDVLPTKLQRAGAKVIDVTAYRTVQTGGAKDGGPNVLKMLLDQRIDVVTFTSASTVRNFVKVLGTDSAADLLNTTVVAAIGPVTADAAAHLNIDTTIMPTTYTVPALVDAIVKHYSETQFTGQ